MRTAASVVALLAIGAGLLATVATARPASHGSAQAVAASRTCGGQTCVSVDPDYAAPRNNVVLHGSRVEIDDYLSFSGPAPRSLVITVRQDPHFPIDLRTPVRLLGSGVDSPQFTVVAQRTSLVLTPAPAAAQGNGLDAEFFAAPDRYARDDVRSNVSVRFVGSDGHSHTVDAGQTIPQNRPDLRVGLDGVGWPRPGRVATEKFKVENLAYRFSGTVQVALTVSKGFALDKTRGVRISGHTLRCTGVRHVHCQVSGTAFGMRTVMRVRVHASRHLRPGHRGSVFAVLTPVGYDNLSRLNSHRIRFEVA